ncbi:AMP-binding protein [Butyrivibrio proteoclasticus]|uniref:AMP-binding protein n=1 Tax=Butyrivibrio proteoclasticus TaxID=43305 RepID=UPI000A450949|nr:AMP-binding protein [Butyrivibrio proteoclasticus]
MIEVKTPWYKYYDNVKKHLDYPDISVYDLLKESADKHGDNISYNYFGTKATFKKFIEQIDECARAFKALGVNEGDRVSICMPNTPEALISFYALNKIGAISNMIHPLSAEREIKYYIDISESRFIVTIDLAFNKINHVAKDTCLEKAIVVSVKDSMPLYMGVLFQVTKGRKIKVEKSDIAISWKQFISGAAGYTGPLTSGEDDSSFDNNSVVTIGEKNYRIGNRVASILYSGGTTGYPKGIELTNLNFNALAMQSFEACACLHEKDKVLSIMPVFHGFGLGICIHTVQYFGGTSIILPTFSAATFHKLLMKYKPNIIAGVPTLYEALLKNKHLEGYDLSFLKCVISGGDSLSVSLKGKVDAFLHEHGADIQVREGYGLTECVTGSCLTPEKYYREGSIGIPYPDTYYKIIKPDTTEELPYGEEGEIAISGPSVMKGYLKDKEETDKTLRVHEDGLTWLHTGDLGYMDEDGFIYFKQRLKRMIVSSGYNIYPQYIENTIDSHPDVLMSCVIGIPHEYKVEVAKAFIVLKNGVEKSSEELESIKQHCEKNLAKYSWPYAYEFRDELPKTLVGKIAYNELSKEEQLKNEKK